MLGYEIKETEKNISVKHPMATRFIRLKSIGNDYTNDKVIDRILELNKEKVNYFPMYDRIRFDIRPYYEKYKQRRLTGLQRLFLHYQYVLKIIPKDNRSKPKSEDREEYIWAIKNLESITHQTTILCQNHIETFDDLHDYMSKLENQLEQFTKERNKYRNQVRNCKDEKVIKELKNKAKSLTPNIAKFLDEKEKGLLRRKNRNERN